MNVTGRFFVAELAWATGIFVLMVCVGALDSDPPSAAVILQWLARAIGLAAFPAGIVIAPVVFKHERRWRRLLLALAAASTVSLVVFVLRGVVAPLAGGGTLPQLFGTMSTAGESWETRNDAAWAFYNTFLVPVNALLFAAIGVQVGIWATLALPIVPLRRALYWAVGLGLVISGAAVWDTTYETVILWTAADASFAAFYTVLIPASICAGLALPTLALARRGELPWSTS